MKKSDDNKPPPSNNHLFIKSVSPLATETTVRQFFLSGSVDEELQNVEFIQYPDCPLLRYCCLSFASSNGIIAAMSLNGSLLNGVPTDFSVIDPGQTALVNPQQTESLATKLDSSVVSLGLAAFNPTILFDIFQEALASGGICNSPKVQALQNLLISSGGASPDQAALLMTVLASATQYAMVSSPSRSAVNSALVNAVHRANNDGGLGGWAIELLKLSSTQYKKETENQHIARTLFVCDFPETWLEEDVVTALRDEVGLGSVLDIRLDTLPVNGVRFALAEFATSEAVQTACTLPTDRKSVTLNQTTPVVVLRFEPAKATVRPREPENVSFTMTGASLASVPIAYQSLNKLNLEEKLARVRARARKIAAETERRIRDTQNITPISAHDDGHQSQSSSHCEEDFRKHGGNGVDTTYRSSRRKRNWRDQTSSPYHHPEERSRHDTHRSRRNYDRREHTDWRDTRRGDDNRQEEDRRRYVDDRRRYDGRRHEDDRHAEPDHERPSDVRLVEEDSSARLNRQSGSRREDRNTWADDYRGYREHGSDTRGRRDDRRRREEIEKDATERHRDETRWDSRRVGQYIRRDWRSHDDDDALWQRVPEDPDPPEEESREEHRRDGRYTDSPSRRRE